MRRADRRKGCSNICSQHDGQCWHKGQGMGRGQDRKGLERKNSKARKQIGLLNNTFTSSIKKLRESARNTDDSG
ncbi:hypothetical protein KSB_51090 [Ktedonobacter robiniae]|uniref:Uncharacterized protein n=2 Tax=Ktedonobacter robiniae TaxID=2778365 RepID=A0ABQ3UVB6_9CHLR|nr:hypothetical protein KSB_51090 [Ktedonobacter robiniae]